VGRCGGSKASKGVLDETLVFVDDLVDLSALGKLPNRGLLYI